MKVQQKTETDGKSVVEQRLSFRELLEMRDTLRTYNEDTGERSAQFHSAGIIWRMRPQMRLIEVVIIDYFDNNYTQELQVKFPGSSTQFNESPREAFNRAVVTQTGLRVKGNERMIYSAQEQKLEDGAPVLVHAKLFFVMQVPYVKDQNLNELSSLIEGSEYSNPRWEVADEKLLDKLFHTYHGPYKKFLQNVAVPLLSK